MPTRTGIVAGVLSGSLTLIAAFIPSPADVSAAAVPHAVTALLDTASVSLARFVGSPRCATVVQALENDWQVTGEWRALAPWPVAREATPTTRIGVWVERSHPDNGTVEYRRVSASETTVATLDADGCLHAMAEHHRTFNDDALRDAFTDTTLDSLLQVNTRGMVYVWSPRMPLSVNGLAEARAAAGRLGIAFTAVLAEDDRDAATTPGATQDDQRRLESLELVYRNSTIHYPTALFYADGHIIDGVYPGYKNRDTYVQYALRQFAGARDADGTRDTNESRDLLANDARSVRLDVDGPTFWVDHKAVVTTVSRVNTVRRIGFFFKPITGTNLISYTAGNVAYFFDIVTGKEQRVPGYVDPVPTPDGRFLTLPGLHYFQVAELLRGNQKPMYSDPELPDEYQTATILSSSRSRIRYRVVTGWNAGARFREYDVTLDAKGVPSSISAASAPFVPCKNRLLTLPIHAKSGAEFGAYDAGMHTNIVLEVVDESHCALKLDLGFASGKISFSYDGASIAFATSRINTDVEGPLMRPSDSFFKDALVLVRKTGRLVRLSDNVNVSGMTYPEFQKDGTVMLLDQVAPGRPVEQIRVVRFR